MERSRLAGMRFAMYSHSNMWMPEQSRLVEEGDDDKKMMETARDFYNLTSTQAPFHERGTAVVRPDASKNVPYNPNVVYTSRPVFKYTCPQKPKTVSQRKKHYNEMWRNSAPLEENTPLESFTVGRYFRDSKVGKSAVSVRAVDGRFIPTPPIKLGNNDDNSGNSSLKSAPNSPVKRVSPLTLETAVELKYDLQETIIPYPQKVTDKSMTK
ncbi:uncharacterized protein LOC134821831 isoform X2 [Bolinopsis microptera]|uniref:uncharacterized protein LOC134821831 isoform X2 n=1 Tax=Bolinopsis microptera TaxID=2820187 RepID=UPI00307A4A6C